MALILYIPTMPHFVFGSLFIWPKLSHNVIVKQLKNVMFLIFVKKHLEKHIIVDYFYAK